MRVTKGFKYQHQDFGSKGFEVSVTHEELGLSAPSNPDEFYRVAAELSYHCEMLRTIEEARQGLVKPEAIRERADKWKPTE